MLADKRGYPRKECELQSSFKDLDGKPGSRPRLAIIKDISQSGVRLRINDFIPLNSRLHLSLSLPKHENIEIPLKTAWITELPHLGKYELGGSFAGLSQHQIESLHHFLTAPEINTPPIRLT